MNNRIKKRILWVDMLNIMACFCVLMLHCNHQAKWYDGTKGIEFEWIYGMIIYSLFFWPVPIFLMLSVAKLLNYKTSTIDFYKRRFVKVGIPFIFWSIFYCVANITLFGEEYPLKYYVKYFIYGNFNPNMWFFVPLFCLYLSMPFIKTIIENSSTLKVVWFVVLGFFFTSFLPWFFDVVNVDYFESKLFNMGANFISIGVAGYYIANNDISKKWRKWFYLSSVFIIVFHFFMLLFFSLHNNNFPMSLINYAYPLSFVVPIGVMLFFKYTNWAILIKKIRIKEKYVSIVSDCCLGIYLLHCFFQKLTINGKPIEVFHNHYYGFIILFVLCGFIVHFMKKNSVLSKVV